MATGDIKLAYGSVTTITMDLTSLASSSTFIAGRESTQVDNTSNKFVGAKVYGRFIVGTTPTLPCTFNLYLWGADVSLATTAIDVLDGTDSAETLTNTTVLNSTLVLVRSPQILVNTSNITYDIVPFNVEDYLGPLPSFWGLYVAHNMTAALKTDAGNTNAFRYQGAYYTVA